MPDLLIRDIDAELKRQIEERAAARGRSLSEEAKWLIRTGLHQHEPDRKLGTLLSKLVAPEQGEDDLVFERPGRARPPPDFE